MLVYQIKDVDLKKRADLIMHQAQPQLSRNLIKQLSLKNKFIFNNQPIEANYQLKTLGTLKLDYNFSDLNQIAPLKLNIIFEDQHLIIINKPAGLLVHPPSPHWNKPTVASALRQHCQWPTLRYDAQTSDLRKGIVHRLDQATSGLLICAKNDLSFKKLQRQFYKRTVVKTYLGLIAKNTKLPQNGLIDKPIARQVSSPRRFIVAPDGKASQTIFKIKQKYNHYYLLQITPKTGRTHQIRVHLASLNCPLIGDDLYGGQSAERLMLHAQKISFQHPFTKQDLQFTTICPKIFKQIGES